MVSYVTSCCDNNVREVASKLCTCTILYLHFEFSEVHISNGLPKLCYMATNIPVFRVHNFCFLDFTLSHIYIQLEVVPMKYKIGGFTVFTMT